MLFSAAYKVRVGRLFSTDCCHTHTQDRKHQAVQHCFEKQLSVLRVYNALTLAASIQFATGCPALGFAASKQLAEPGQLWPAVIFFQLSFGRSYDSDARPVQTNSIPRCSNRSRCKDYSRWLELEGPPPSCRIVRTLSLSREPDPMWADQCRPYKVVHGEGK
jgi:hypothetical protein